MMSDKISGYKVFRASEGIGWFLVQTKPPCTVPEESKRLAFIEAAIREKLERESLSS